MNWPDCIRINRAELLPMVAGMFAMLGDGETVLRHVHLAILALLRPAESSARRLIAIAALSVTFGMRAKRAAPTGPIPKGSGTKRAAVFQLIDPRRHIGPVKKYARWAGIRAFDGTHIPAPPTVEPGPDDPVSALIVRRRLEALRDAMDDIPAQARRLARITAALDRPIRAMRPGRPPGHVARGRRAVDILLANCHALALMAYAEVPVRDTS